MVHGLEKFKEYFKDYSNQYVFIGGTACHILMNDIGLDFRTTPDLDIVLIIEALDNEFCEKFCQFIEDGGYAHRNKNTGEDQFYRFDKPSDEDFPKMIELFSRKSEKFDLKLDNGLTPIHIEDSIISLSAILLNDEYYEILITGKTLIDGYPIIETETVILFKMKAWLDMKERVNNGEHVDSKNIKKHKRDIFRLLTTVNPSGNLEIPYEIEQDVRLFIKQVDKDRPKLKDYGIDNVSFEEMIELIGNLYLNDEV